MRGWTMFLDLLIRLVAVDQTHLSCYLSLRRVLLHMGRPAVELARQQQPLLERLELQLRCQCHVA